MASSQKTFLGIDIGGSKIEGILWSRGVLRAKKINTASSRKKFLEDLFDLVTELKAGRKIFGIGIGSAGTIDLGSGRILFGPNTKILNKLDLAAFLRKKFKTPVRVDNDAKCFLRGEHMFGSGRGKKHLVGLTLGTGVGGAVISDGKMLRGSATTAYELGHMIIADRGLTPEKLISSHGFRVNPLRIQNAAFAGNAAATRIYDKIGKHLGVTLANLANIFEPELMIIGGGISRAGDLLLRPALKEMKKHVTDSVRIPPVKISKLKYAGALGAAALFKD